jgi:NAD(P)-dependent dehydrogenase (short-subunit alcohol dehydrogenase family)
VQTVEALTLLALSTTGEPSEHAGRFAGRRLVDAHCIPPLPRANLAAMNDLEAAGTFVILGATGAVGSHLAANLHARGAKLVLLARDADRLAAIAGPLGAGTALLPAVDAGSIRTALVGACRDTPVAGIAHCVGSLLLKPAHRTSAEEWHAVLETNLSSAFGVVMAVPEIMPTAGSVVFCSSVAANVGLANHEAIAAAKAGVQGLARAAAATHARRGVRFHCVAPALVDSRMTAPLLERAGMREAAAKQNPLGRIGTPGDVARAIAFLLDPQNAWIDGQVLGVDGGFGSVRGVG